MTAFFQGLSLGLAYVAPIGLQNLFVINSALSRPRWVAFRIAGIVIFFDILLSMAGFFGVGAIITRSDLAKMVILGVGSLLVFVGHAIVEGGLDGLCSNLAQPPGPA